MNFLCSHLKIVFVHQEIGTDDVVSLRALADSIIRHDGFESYNESWRGHLADICSTMDWSLSPTDSLDSSDLYQDYFRSVYRPCAFVEDSTQVSETQTEIPCVIVRPNDPVMQIDSSLVGTSYNIVGQRGHTPLVQSPQLEEVLTNFWDVCK